MSSPAERAPGRLIALAAALALARAGHAASLAAAVSGASGKPGEDAVIYYVVDTPYFAKTDAAGAAKIAGRSRAPARCRCGTPTSAAMRRRCCASRSSWRRAPATAQ